VNTHGSVAKSVRLHREKHPELYCSKCLWRTGGGDCPRHRSKGVRLIATIETHPYGYRRDEVVEA
jgi:hypothetical protein